ncbi:MBL fold metallo-hydrolase [Halieaceae bacterium IMCC14734]|uniref:MBL fold metallo-hydrolase n=1 Tax=Candidatus Litorirhabdus singularis TaxID=2518993 RepID=A0ABT3TKV1_9GAMM|nr:MBL fold metallo-hydrolase [Candidatus Litorirhabdus singularis]MCX2982930.1 MBL fold metallo-hydrolase [Candidatus Litorirhabdus singularis]
MKKILVLLLGLLVMVGIGRFLLTLPAVQDRLLERGTEAIAKRGAVPLAESESLRVYVCGSASPLGMGQAQACIAVITPEHFYLIDSGAGSTDNINRLGLPTDRLQGLLLTHFHSDHIAEIYEVNLASWVRGRPHPLTIFGPKGVDEVTNGVNASYRQDRMYRTGHHGEDLLVPALGVLAHKTIAPGVILEDGDLKISAYVAEHPPIHPAVGYRFDYRGRSVVISGDSNVNGATLKIVEGADLLLHDALSLPTVTALSKALGAAGQTRQSKIVADVMDYHASTDSLIELGKQSDVDMVAFYHLVPVPPNSVLKEIFKRGIPDNFLLAEDLMWFELPIDSDDIVVNNP